MKTKKVLLVSLLSAALVATSACNLLGGTKKSKKKSSSSATTSITTSGDPGEAVVARIRVTQLQTIVVNETVDLDDYISVEYSDGTLSKDFVVEVPESSEGKVSVDGHKVVYLTEGEITINIKAGQKNAMFTVTALSVIKDKFNRATGGLMSDFGYAGVYYDEDEEQYVIYPEAIHNENYTCFASWGGSATDPLPGGFLRSKSGTTWAYELDENYENIDVDAEPYTAEFDKYLVNMAFSVHSSVFETRTEEDEEGEEVEYLYVDKSVPAPRFDYIEGVNTYIDEFCICNFAFMLNENYYFDSMKIYLEEMTEGKERFLFVLDIVGVESGEVEETLADFLIYNTDTDLYGVEAVEEYIESGQEPESQDFTALKDKFSAIAEAKNYTVEIESQEAYMDSKFTTVQSIQYTLNDTVYANEDQYEDTGHWYKPAGEDEEEDENETYCAGLVEHNGSLYSYSYDEENDKYPAKLIAAGQTVWGNKLSSTFSYLANEGLWSGFYVTKIQSISGGSRYSLFIPRCRQFIDSFLDNSYAGRQIAYIVEQYKALYETDFLTSYGEAYIDVTSSQVVVYVSIQVPFSDANVLWDIKATFSDIGTTADISTNISYQSDLIIKVARLTACHFFMP